MAETSEMVERCQAAVYKRDTYRYTGRTKSGFEMHYTKCRCGRFAKHDGLCSQHADMDRRWGGSLPRW